MNQLPEKVNVLDKGFIKVIDYLPRIIPEGYTADYAVVEAARVSYNKGLKTPEEDKKLLRYLYEHKHFSPFEMAHIKFHIKCPIFVARQWMRHRNGCLSGDTLLHFELPNIKRGRRIIRRSIKEIHDRWHNPQIMSVNKKKAKLAGVDKNLYYTVPQLARIVDLDEEYIRSLIYNGKIFYSTQKTNSIKDPKYVIKGQHWYEYVLNIPKVKIDRKNIIKNMNLRSCNEETGLIETTNITNIWESGIKSIFKVTLDNGYSIKMTKDHRCLTNNGWKTLEEAVDLKFNEQKVIWTNNNLFSTNGEVLYKNKDWLKTQRELGLSVQQIADAAGIGYVCIRKWLKIYGLQYSPKERAIFSSATQRGRKRGSPKIPRIWTEEAKNKIRAARSGEKSNFWKGGVTKERANIGRWTTEHAQEVHKKYNYQCQICGNNRKLEAHHIDPVYNNLDRALDINNLITLCKNCHRQLHNKNLELVFLDYYNSGKSLNDFNLIEKQISTKKIRNQVVLKREFNSVVNIEYVGEEMTYDLEVSGPYHNFVANGFIVHNSFNEISGRFVELKNEYYIPEIENIKEQSSLNKQSTGNKVVTSLANKFLEVINKIRTTFIEYDTLVSQGLAREQARIILPVSTYTEFYWYVNLRSLLNFIELRNSPHAQDETREYAKVINNIAKQIFPWTMEAFEDFTLNSITFTKEELQHIYTMENSICIPQDAKLSERKRKELERKVELFNDLT